MNIRLAQAHGLTLAAVGDPAVTALHFGFDGPDGRISSGADARALPQGDAASLDARVTQAMAGLAPDQVIGGALPFDRAADDCLWQATRDSRPVAPAMPGLPPVAGSVQAQPTAGDYARMVARALALMEQETGQQNALEKIVLARSLLVHAKADIPVDAVMARLNTDPNVTAFRVALPTQGHPRTLCGASPELLVRKSGKLVFSHPLAGSAKRIIDPGADRAAADALSQSAKDHREHAFVVEAILDTLSPYCRELSCPEGTRITSTRSMWHLGTKIQGRLRDDSTPAVLLASALHPTPAVCGVPTLRAARLIRDIEPVARDFYAGAVGWCDAKGDGAWHVAIRCAEISGPQARLYAGAGIVPGSDPQAEAAETGAKFGAFLAALGLPADAGLDGVQSNGEN